jgi:hypothetical protein
MLYLENVNLRSDDVIISGNLDATVFLIMKADG